MCLLALCLVSCKKTREDDVDTRSANLVLNFTESGDTGNREMLKTIRFIVFRDASSNFPRMDVNEYVAIAEGDQKMITEIGANYVEVTPNDDILVAVIINEPGGLKNQLDAVQHQGELENIVYDIADILNSNDTITAMPIIGVIRDIAVAKDQTESVTMVVERAVARIDIYLEAMQGSVETGYTAGSSVTVHNLSYNSYFAMGNADNDTRDNATSSKNFGKVMTDVSDLFDKTWTPSSTARWSYSGVPADDRKLLCSFYTAERIFKADYSDRIAVSLTNIKRANMLTGIANKDIATVSNGGTVKAFTEIRRNNVYQITAQVEAVVGLTLTVSVEDWGPPQDVDIIIN